MSIILDALKRGRARSRPTPPPAAGNARTDAVLHTLGYSRLDPKSPLNRLKRFGVYLGVAAAGGLLLWATVMLVTRTSEPARQSAAPAPQPTAPSARVITQKPAGHPAAHDTPQQATPAADPEPAALPPAPLPGGTAPIQNPAAGAVDRSNVPLPAPAAPLENGTPKTARPRPVPPPPLPIQAGAPTVSPGDDQFARALMYQRLGDFENALVHYMRVLQRDDLNVEAHNNLGVLYKDKGLLDDAVRQFQRAIAISPRYARARNNLGVAYLSQGRLELAAAQFHAALAIEPKSVETLVNLAAAERESGRRDEAKRLLTRALEIDSRSAAAHYNLGLLEDEAGNTAGALSHYAAFLRHGIATHPELIGEVNKRVHALGGK